MGIQVFSGNLVLRRHIVWILWLRYHQTQDAVPHLVFRLSWGEGGADWWLKSQGWAAEGGRGACLFACASQPSGTVITVQYGSRKIGAEGSVHRCLAKGWHGDLDTLTHLPFGVTTHFR